MEEFIYFPASSITQIDRDSFNLVDIYGGKFNLKLPHLEVYLSCPTQLKKEFTNRKMNFMQGDYLKIINDLIENKIIYPSKIKKQSPFNRKKVLEKINSSSFREPRTLNIGEATLELTQNCPYNCSGCFRELNNEEPLSNSNLESLVDELSDIGISKIALSGGEITASKNSFNRFKHIASYSKKKGIDKIRLLTTGYNSERVNEALNYIDEIQISIDGLRESHNSYKKSDNAFERAIESLKISETNEKVKLTTNTVVSKKNLSEIPFLIDYLSNFNINTYRITKMVTSDSGLRLSISEAEKLYQLVREKQERYPNLKIINAYGDCTDILNCTGGIIYAHIGATGNVFGCDYDINNIAGNIKQKSFQDIWTNSSVLQKYRTISPLEGDCLDCESRVFCFGNCWIEKENNKIAGGCNR